MADTIVQVDGIATSGLKLFLYAREGATGTPDATGYELAAVSGQPLQYSTTVAEALVGDFLAFVAVDQTAMDAETIAYGPGYITLADDTNSYWVSGQSAEDVAAIQSGLSTFDHGSDNITGTVGGIAGTIKTLDALDAQQDAQHATTQNTLGTPANADIAADIAAVKTDTGNLVARVTATLFSGITSMAKWLGAIAGKTADTSTRTEINATTAGASYNETTDSLEAQKDAGGGGDATLAKQNEILSRLSGVAITTTGRVASGGALTLYLGDDHKVRSGTELEISVADVGGALYTKLDALGTSALTFGASRLDQSPGQITGTIAAIDTSGSGADEVCVITVEITAAGEGLRPADDYEYQIAQKQTQGSDIDDYVEISGNLTLLRRRVATGD